MFSTTIFALLGNYLTVLLIIFQSYRILWQFIYLNMADIWFIAFIPYQGLSISSHAGGGCNGNGMQRDKRIGINDALYASLSSWI